MPEVVPALRRRRSWPRLRRWLLSGALVTAVAALAANAHVVAAARGLMVTVAQAPARPFLIVPGNLVSRSGIPSPELAERLETALALYRAGRAPKIIVSGLTRGRYSEPRSMAAWLIAHDVPPGAVILDLDGYRTAATIANAVALGVHSALIASQHYHLARSIYLARHAGMDLVGVSAPRAGNTVFGAALTQTREVLARAEVVLEVAWRGVRP